MVFHRGPNECGQLAGTIEYTECIFAEGYDFPKECLRYDIKHSGGKVPVMVEL